MLHKWFCCTHTKRSLFQNRKTVYGIKYIYIYTKGHSKKDYIRITKYKTKKVIFIQNNIHIYMYNTYTVHLYLCKKKVYQCLYNTHILSLHGKIRIFLQTFPNLYTHINVERPQHVVFVLYTFIYL